MQNRPTIIKIHATAQQMAFAPLCWSVYNRSNDGTPETPGVPIG